MIPNLSVILRRVVLIQPTKFVSSAAAAPAAAPAVAVVVSGAFLAAFLDAFSVPPDS